LYPYAGWTDEALLPAPAAIDQVVRAEIYARYWHRVFILAYRYLKLRETAEELVQDLFTVLWHRRAAHAFQHLAHYLLAAFGQGVLDHLRAYQVREAYADYCRWHEATTHEIEHPLAVAGLTKAVSNALLCLPAPTREVLRLNWFEHFSIPELV